MWHLIIIFCVLYAFAVMFSMLIRRNDIINRQNEIISEYAAMVDRLMDDRLKDLKNKSAAVAEIVDKVTDEQISSARERLEGKKEGGDDDRRG